MVSADALRKRPAGAGGKEKRAPAKEDGDEDKYDRKPPVTSSADPDRKPDVFDTHIGPFIESYVLWCQRKGIIGWVLGISGVMSFTLVMLFVGGGLGWYVGQGLVLGMDKVGLLEKLREGLNQLDGKRG
mmetsp:Transcript_15872/g.40473  ORF Transcript_15872/g.40473 Transcript_15872/m.40473 type:complete len:129 (-) Transcript_15872:2020-2406(-)